MVRFGPSTVAMSVIVAVSGCETQKGACDEPCPVPPKHYAELGCKPILEEGQCCPKRYQCPELTDRDGNKCYFNGNIYPAGAKLAPAEQEIHSCSPACFCSNHTAPATFRCASIDCFEFFEPTKEDCIHQYTLHGCCAEKSVCGADKLAKLAQCYLDGRQYYEGQRMYPKEESCKFCYCKPGFDNSTVGADNPNCYETQCGLELHAGDRIAMGCIPIYFGNHRCCPISWKCPSDSDEVIVEGRIEQDDDAQPEPAMQCKFGKLTLNKGDGVSSDDKCVECKCTVPPLAHCIQREDC
ncbi:uncharacterized protein LOC120900971 isoform X1 [Anopheles arabiensis]|uniref:uncharacterized protein LOC120900971 isoform X1 n=1 Tax=Anopheles arabiensis TaxID=7173 RepID=UPI001AADFC54|nr:uncharacterized protein LOC120900971 isoform X1 [Anopheles arabiensis]